MSAVPAALPAARFYTVARVDASVAPVTRRESLTWDDLAHELTQHQAGPKEGAGWMPASISPGPRKAERVEHITMIVLDVEAEALKGPNGIKQLAGSLPPSISALAAELELRGWAGILSSTYSHEEPIPGGTTLGPRYRVVIEVSRPILPAELRPLAQHVADSLGIGRCVDRACMEPARLFYMPRCPAERLELAESARVDGQPLDVDVLLREAHASAEPPPRAGRLGASVIKAFNDAHDVATIIEQHGYKKAGANRWLWPGSTTGMPGVRMLPDSGRLFSSHSGDPLHGDHSHDAFSAWCVLAHAGDMSAAVKHAARMVGMERAVEGSPSSPRISSVLPVEGGVAPEGAEPDTWPEVRAITTELPAAPPFEAKVLLPDTLADFVLDEADRMPCAPDYIAAALLVCLGSAIGARCGIKPKRRDDWIVTPNLYGGIVGDPSTKKSPALGVVTRFLDRLEAGEVEKLGQAIKVHEAELAAFEAHQAVVKAAMKRAASGKPDAPKMEAAVADMQALQPPEAPQQRRFKSNDSTVAKLGDMLVHNPYGMLVYRDELIGLLASWDKDGNEGDRAFYLEGWNGTSSFSIDRIGRGSQHIKNLCLSVFGGIQPELLERYLAGMAASFDNDGRVQRFQVLVYPDSVPWAWRDRHPVKGARQAVRDLFHRLAEFDPLMDGASPADDFVKLPHFGFDDEAQSIFVQWATELHTKWIPGEVDPLMRQHLGKFEKLFCAIALILHLAENIGPVNKASALRAAAWCQYLAGHARRVYALVEAGKVSTANMLGRRIAEGKLQDGFTVRDVVRKQWSGITTSMQAESALAVLEGHGWIVSAERAPVDGGRPTTRHYISPKVQR
jgi:hypothetical protein